MLANAEGCLDSSTKYLEQEEKQEGKIYSEDAADEIHHKYKALIVIFVKLGQICFREAELTFEMLVLF